MFFVKNCFQSLWFNKLRSALTGIGVLIGVTSVVMVMALSASLLASLDKETVG
jgi:ABC-type antimicrobial peptide transport system permease subunit